ncbi:transposase, IS605 OrfB family, central region [Singulisphaera sp. GP187]|nr:transposase, IS605 OrfB family, central region [Singulisphaera sp. GP187]
MPPRNFARPSSDLTRPATGWRAGVAFDKQVANRIELQRIAYRDVRDKFSLSAQATCLCIRRVCEAYKRDKTIRPTFRKDAAMPFDPRTMSFKGIARVSLLTLDGRVIVPFVVGSYGADRLAMPKGQADLVRRKDGKWFLIVTVDVPETTPIPVTDFIGVDLGLANVATDSDPATKPHCGKPAERVRRKHNLQRKRLQKKGTKGAKKKLQRVSRKEARFKRHENHVISKAIVEVAKGTGRGIAVEDLSGIRDRLPAWGKDARNRLSGWSFGQLVAFMTYKATLAGVPIEAVDARYTSQTCSACGHCCRENRTSQAKFLCVSCGMGMNADKNAALNIRARALSKRALELVDLTV